MFLHLIFHEIAMLQARRIVSLDTVIDMFCNTNTAVHTACAAHGDDKLALALFRIIWQKKVDHRIEMLFKFLCDLP